MERRLWNAEALPKQHIHMQVCGWAPPPASFFRGHHCQWRTEGGLGVQTPPPPEIPKAIQNRAKLNPIVKNVKICSI